MINVDNALRASETEGRQIRVALILTDHIVNTVPRLVESTKSIRLIHEPPVIPGSSIGYFLRRRQN